MIKIGDKVQLIGTVVSQHGIEGQTDPSRITVGVQLRDGQGIVTNIQNPQPYSPQKAVKSKVKATRKPAEKKAVEKAPEDKAVKPTGVEKK